MTTTTGDAAVQAGLFERLGGYDAVERAVGRLLTRVAADPALSSLLPGGSPDSLRWGIQLLLTDRLGGPMAYDGPDPAEVARRSGLDISQWRLLLGHLLTCLSEEGVEREPLDEARRALETMGESLGLPPAGLQAMATPAERAIAAAGELVSAGGLAEWNLFVLSPELVVIHQSEAAVSAVQACDGELRRCFGLGAANLPGHSILRFHPAPTRLQVMLGEGARLPQETTWAFGRVVWKAVMHALRAADGALLGYAMLWKDESEVYLRRAVVERLRAEAEDLPVPVMFPGPSLNHWLGNAACEHALQRLGPHLSRPINPIEGVPIQLFFPDEAEREVLFADPSRLPFKRQIRIGHETIAILVSPVLDEQQRFVVPQITWEIVHVTRPASPPAEPVALAPAPAPAPAIAPAKGPQVDAASPTSAALRAEARALEAATQEMLLLSRLLLAVADDTDGQLHAARAEPGVIAAAAVQSESETGQVAEAALAVLAAAREVPPGHERREETAKALATLTGIARRANRLALDGALLAVQDEGARQAGALVEESRGFARSLVEGLRTLSARAQASSEALRQGSATATRLAALRSQLGEPGDGQA